MFNSRGLKPRWTRLFQHRTNFHRPFYAQEATASLESTSSMSETISSYPIKSKRENYSLTYNPEYVAKWRGSESFFLHTRSPDFIPFHLHLRTWLPDRIYSILQQRPLPIPSSLPGLSESNPGLSESNPQKVWTYLPPNLPESPEEQEDFLEEESIYHPNILLYRFYACGGFWICSSMDIELFLLSISPKALCQSVPFIRQVLKAKIRHQVPRLEDQDHNFRNLTKTVDDPSNLGAVYDLLFRALATQGRVQESISLWEECESLRLRLRWRSLKSLFNCFENATHRVRVKKAIDLYQSFLDRGILHIHVHASLADALLRLIFKVARHGGLKEDMDFDDLLDLVLELGSIIATAQKDENLRFSSRFEIADLSSAQLRTVLYLQVCSLFGRIGDMIDAYEEAIKQGVQFTRWMYSVALTCTCPPFGTNASDTSLKGIQQTIFQHMIKEGLQPGILEWRSLLKGARNRRDQALGMEIFKLIEREYSHNYGSQLIYRNQVCGLDIYFLVGCFYPKDSVPSVSNMVQDLELIDSMDWEGGLALFRSSGMYDVIKNATTFPFSGSSRNVRQNVCQCISILSYLARKYPDLFLYPQIYNLYLSIAVRLGLRSVPNIVRRCFDHYSEQPRSEDQSSKSGEQSKYWSRYPWHWPLPVDEQNVVPHLPSKLPRPTNYTFMLAMEYANAAGDVRFGHYVWRHRKIFRRHFTNTVWQEAEGAMWSELRDEEMTSWYEELLARKEGTALDPSRIKFSEGFTIGGSKNLYEGYIRLQYIELLAKEGRCQKAYETLLKGTGDTYDWTQEMLRKVRERAKLHGHTELMKYIDNLKTSGVRREMEEHEVVIGIED